MRTTSLSIRYSLSGSSAGKKWFPVISQHPHLHHLIAARRWPGPAASSNPPLCLFVLQCRRQPASPPPQLHTVDRRSHSAASGPVFIAADRMLTAIVAGESAAAVAGTAVRAVEIGYFRQDTVILSRSVSRCLLFLLRRQRRRGCPCPERRRRRQQSRQLQHTVNDGVGTHVLRHVVHGPIANDPLLGR